MKTGDLVLFRGHGPFAWFIRLWTRSAWCHCGVLWVCEGVEMVLEARYSGGVSCHALANRKEDRPMVYPTGKPVYVPLALQCLGSDYSVKDAIRAGFNRSGDHAGWQCAEFAALLLGLDHNSRGWTPQSLVQYLCK